ncbi:MAG: hypothetical protein RBU23_08360 [Candidatus Auribacterota bacterium]|jgi:hypothetical protein|nr:hypothetical protein [Candidatus Auribacterota bacterium]
MVSPNDIKNADKALENGFLEEAKSFFSHLLMDTDDPVLERIAQNRLDTIAKRMKEANDCCQLHIDHTGETDDFFICTLTVIYKLHHLQAVISDIFSASHKRDYPEGSSITIYKPAAQKICVELSGYKEDERCDWCRLFRKNLVYYIGKYNMLRVGHCPFLKEV